MFNTFVTTGIVAVFLGACSLRDAVEKNGCDDHQDCLNGYSCVKGTCLPDDETPDGGTTPDQLPDQTTPDQMPAVPGNWVTVPPGTFFMGSPPDEPCREEHETKHQVTLTHRFEIQTTETTIQDFESVMNYTDLGTSIAPIHYLTWHEAVAYCNTLSNMAGLDECYDCTEIGTQDVDCSESTEYSGQDIYACPGFRLPTEAEWEYSYRAGTATAFHNGPMTADSCYGDVPNADDIAWYVENSGGSKQHVGMKTSNAWGLFDMAGNVYEWCHDWYDEDLGSSPVIDPWGHKFGTDRVVRGGNWHSTANKLRAAHRRGWAPWMRGLGTGFRCVRTLPK